LFGIVEGVTEWLPVSSTGHLILLDEFFPMGISDAFREMFEVVIQLGAILAVVVLFFKKLNPFGWSKTSGERKNTWSLWLRVIFANIPSGVVGVLFDDWFNDNFYNPWVVALTLILYGVAFIVIEMTRMPECTKIDSTGKITYRHAVLIGLFQIIAIIPVLRAQVRRFSGHAFRTFPCAAAEFFLFYGNSDNGGRKPCEGG
jgi:undecaprenyl-diphosphatase